SAREAAALAALALYRFLELLIDVTDQILLAVSIALRMTNVGAVGLHVPGAFVGCELTIQNRPQLLSQRGILDRRDRLDSALEVALHQVRRADEIFLGAAVAEIIDAPVFEEAPHDADHAYGFRKSSKAGTQPAGVANDEVD